MNRDFKGIWIPADLWLDENLSALDKIIYAEIDSLDCGDGCFAGNEYLAEFCQCSERKISDAVAKLIDIGYIETARFDGRRRILRVRVAKNARQSRKKCDAESQKVRGSYSRNNIGNNIKNNNNKPSVEEIRDYCAERKNNINADEFFDYYESVGWMVGKKKMTDWRAAVRTWERNKKTETQPDSSYNLSEFTEKSIKNPPKYRKK